MGDYGLFAPCFAPGTLPGRAQMSNNRARRKSAGPRAPPPLSAERGSEGSQPVATGSAPARCRWGNAGIRTLLRPTPRPDALDRVRVRLGADATPGRRWEHRHPMGTGLLPPALLPPALGEHRPRAGAMPGSMRRPRSTASNRRFAPPTDAPKPTWRRRPFSLDRRRAGQPGETVSRRCPAGLAPVPTAARASSSVPPAPGSGDPGSPNRDSP